MAVRSSKLAVFRSTAVGQHVIYTVPAADAVIVKSWGVYNDSAGGGQYSVGALDVTSGNRCDWSGRYSGNPLLSQESETVLGWWVAEPGDKLYIEHIVGTAFDVWVSGTILTL